MMRRVGKARTARELQWGRDVSIPEIELLQAEGDYLPLLQWGRDVSIPEIRSLLPRYSFFTGFNGAGMFPSQK